MDDIQKADLDPQFRDELMAALRDAHQRLKALESMTDGYYILDSQWRFMAVSPKAERHFGKNAADLIGCDIRKASGTPEDAEMRARFYQTMETGRPCHFEARSPLRPGYWAEIHLFPHETYLEVYFRDISARKKAEAALRQSELRFRKIFEHAAMGIAIADWEGRLQQCNPAYCEMLGYKAAELRHLNFESLLHPEDVADNLAQIRRLSSGEISSFEITNRYIHKEGRPVWVHKRISSLPDRPGDPAHLMALVNDVTPHIEAKTQIEGLSNRLVERTLLAEARTEEVQKLALALSGAEARERSRLAAILHDSLQQMLVSLKLRLNSQSGSGSASFHTVDTNEILDACIDTCRRLTMELQPPVFRNKSILATIRWLCRKMETLYDMEIDLIVGNDIAVQSPVLTEFLIRSLRELLFNVVKHSGGRRASLTVNSEDGQIVICVQDWGVGCDADCIRGKQLDGTVFGLFEIEDRISLLGGRMQVRAEPGQGFGVCLKVPMGLSVPTNVTAKALSDDIRRREDTEGEACTPAVPSTTCVSEAKGPPAILDKMKSYSIILADDHTMLRQGLRDIINADKGLQVVREVENGKELLRILRKIEPDMVVLDIAMPEMGGIEAAQEIKTQHPNVRVLMMSMHKQNQYVADALAAGARGYLLKEDTSEELLNAIDAIRRGEIFLSRKLPRPSAISGHLTGSTAEGSTAEGNTPQALTKRERQVFDLLTEGMANQQVAEQLGISIRTVQQHRTNIRKKLDLKHTADLVRYAVTSGHAGQNLP
jgi:PAS domain S-box-containing protein